MCLSQKRNRTVDVQFCRRMRDTNLTMWSKQAGRQASRQASRHASRHANRHAKKQASTRKAFSRSHALEGLVNCALQTTNTKTQWDPYLLISKTPGLVIKQWYPVNCVATLWVLWSLVPLLQIRSEGLQCYTLMFTSHNRELTAKGGSAVILNLDKKKEIMMNMMNMVILLVTISYKIGTGKDQNSSESI